MQRARRACLAGLGLTLLAPALPGAQEAWPSGPVRVVVPFPAGSTPDLVARIVADHFQSAFGQPFVADNQPGAGGTLGTGQIARASDDRTIGVTINGPITTAKALYPKLGYDPARDLALVSLLVRMPQFLVVNPGLPAEDLAGFLAHARAKPGALSFGSVGPGSAGHLAMEDLKAREGVDLVHVPYKGFPEATLDLVANRIQAMFASVSAVLPQVEAGKLRALAVSADAPIPQAPDVPTLAEAGVPDATSYAWIGLVAPAATPTARQARLAEEARAALDDERNRATLTKAGFEVVGSSPAEFQSFAATETDHWGGLAQKLGISVGG